MQEGTDNISELPLSLQREYKRNYKLQEDPRITTSGKILRKWNLDELPQLYNIIKGDMSFIGPRPVIEEEVEKYGDKKGKFLSIKPGLSGYWQVNRNKCKNYEDRIEMELYYIKNRTLKLDIKIFLKTLKNTYELICEKNKLENIKLLNTINNGE